MAQIGFCLTIEAEAFHDAIREIERVHVALAKRHGATFRLLERDIEGFGEGLTAADVELHSLGDARFIYEIPKLTVLLRRARELGVI